MVVNPGKDPINEQEAVVLLNSFRKIFVTKGRRVIEYKNIHDDKQEAIKAAIGRTGNLRVPSVHFEDSIFVGYNEIIYQDLGK